MKRTCVSHFANLDKKQSQRRSQNPFSFELSHSATDSVAIAFQSTLEGTQAVLCGKKVRSRTRARHAAGESVSFKGWRRLFQISVAAVAVKRLRACSAMRFEMNDSYHFKAMSFQKFESRGAWWLTCGMMIGLSLLAQQQWCHTTGRHARAQCTRLFMPLCKREC
jgi:hypothetical protein